MPINETHSSNRSSFLQSWERSTSRAGNTDASFADQLASSQNKDDTFTPLKDSQIFGKVHILSGMETTLPDGNKLHAFRFDLNENANAALNQRPTEADKRSDKDLYQAMTKLAAYFGQQVTAENTRLEGTAAIDIKL